MLRPLSTEDAPTTSVDFERYRDDRGDMDDPRSTNASPDPKTRVLVVDDDDALRALVGDFLRSQEFIVYSAESATAARRVLAQSPVDLVVLDVMMPGEDGLALARELSSQSNLAIIFVSALGSETDRIVGLEVGADDYLSKPVSPRELLARIRAVLRRRNSRAHINHSVGQFYVFAGWTFDANRRVLYDPSSVVVALSSGELSLLQTFLDRPQRVLTRDQLLEYTRRDSGDVFDRAIDTQISRLRRKLASRDTNYDDLIQTIRNEGYIFGPKVERR